MTQVSSSSLLMLNLYLSLAKAKRPKLEKNFKKFSGPNHFCTVTQYQNQTVLLFHFLYKHKEGPTEAAGISL